MIDDSCDMQVSMYVDTTNHVSFRCELAILQKGHSSEGRLSQITDKPETTILHKLQWVQVTGDRTDSSPSTAVSERLPSLTIGHPAPLFPDEIITPIALVSE